MGENPTNLNLVKHNGTLKNEKQTGAVVLAELLKSLGVTHIFMVPAVLRELWLRLRKGLTSKDSMYIQKNLLLTWQMGMHEYLTNLLFAWPK